MVEDSPAPPRMYVKPTGFILSRAASSRRFQSVGTTGFWSIRMPFCMTWVRKAAYGAGASSWSAMLDV